MTKIDIAIYNYPHALKSSVYGLEELFLFANRACAEQQLQVEFAPVILKQPGDSEQSFDIVLLPPATDSHFYLTPGNLTLDWLRSQHNAGCVIASACAGAFILTASGVANERAVTTHWGLEELFRSHFPLQVLDVNKILIDHGDVISAGGMMSWLDLSLELIARYASAAVMRQVGKMLVVDTAPREQRYYQQFKPSYQHGDQNIVELQQWINLNYAHLILVSSLAHKANMTERTLQRRFHKATGLTPNQYLQRIRVQKACDLLETTNHSFELISGQVGYEDVTACRKVFVKLMGLTPVDFRRRFRH